MTDFKFIVGEEVVFGTRGEVIKRVEEKWGPCYLVRWQRTCAHSNQMYFSEEDLVSPAAAETAGS